MSSTAPVVHAAEGPCPGCSGHLRTRRRASHALSNMTSSPRVSSPAVLTRPRSGSLKKVVSGALGWKPLCDAGCDRELSPSRLVRSNSSTTFELEAARQLIQNPFSGSLTEMQQTGIGGSSSVRMDLHAKRRREMLRDIGSTSMSSAPVETSQMRRYVDPATEDALRRHSAARRLLSKALLYAYPARARATAPPDILLFLVVLGIVVSLVGFCLDVSIEQANKLQLALLRAPNSTLNPCGVSSTQARAAGCALWRAIEWIGYSLLLCWASIWFTNRVSPLACGSGIPEMKSILSGGMKSQEVMAIGCHKRLDRTAWRLAAGCHLAARPGGWRLVAGCCGPPTSAAHLRTCRVPRPQADYLSLRTLIAKVVGLVLALGGGLPIGKEVRSAIFTAEL